MHLITLGGLRLDGVDFRRSKPLLVLAYLTLEGPQDRRRLSRLAFPHARDPMASLRVSLTRLRHAVPEGLNVDGTMVRSNVACDAAALLDDVSGRRGLDDAQYPGPFLAGVDVVGVSVEMEEWVFATRELLAERVRASRLALAEATARRGNRERAARTAVRALSVAGAGPPEPDVLDRAHALLYGIDDQRATLVARALGEYGLDPSTQEARNAPSTRASAHPDRTNLAVPLTAFVGRHDDLRRIEEVLATHRDRLLTLTGTAGVGKTRLSIEVARRALASDRFSDGVFWVGLDALTEAAQVPEHVAAALGLSLTGADPPLDQLTRQLRHRRLLLVLDNYEHLLEGATIPVQLARDCSEMVVLVTTRERLGVQEERVLRLEGLAYPEVLSGDAGAAMAYDAVRLFTMRAQRHASGFRLDATTLPAVSRICRSVGGSPLGLELAAAWIGALTVEDVADELERGLDTLTNRSRDVPEKHRSLAAAFERSWALLDDRQRRALRRLAVFRGGFRRDAAAAVAGASLSDLADLVDKSLVRLAPTGRYDLHPLVHQFCHAKLTADPVERTSCERAHGRYFHAQVRPPDDRTPRSADGWRNLYERLELDLSEVALLRAREELPNLQGAWRHYVDVGAVHAVADVVDFHGNIAESWNRAREGRNLMATALQALDGDEPMHVLARARLEGAMGVIGWRLGRFDEGAAVAERALATLLAIEPPDERTGTWWAAQGAGLCHLHAGRIERALEVLRLGHASAGAGARSAKSAFLRRRLDGMAGLAAAVLGMAAVVAGDLEQARRWSLEARDRMHASTPRAAAYCYYPLASIALAEGDPAAAERWASEGVEHASRVGHDVVIPDLQRSLAYALFRLRRYREAEAILSVALGEAERTDNVVYGTPLRATLGRTLVRLERTDEALPLLLRAADDALATGAVPYALDDALLGLAELAATRGDPVAGRIARFVANLASAHPLARADARSALDGAAEAAPPDPPELAAFVREVASAFA